MTRLPLVRLCQRAPGLRWIGRRIPVHWLFRWVKTTVPFWGWFSLHARKQRRYLYEAMNGGWDRKQLRKIAGDHLVFRRWRTCLTYAWPNVREVYEDWVRIEGEENLTRALDAGAGAILLSGHSYGFSRMVPAVLAERGHSVLRTAMGADPVRWVSRWTQCSPGSWRYLNYDGDEWHRLFVLNRMRNALKDQGILHISIRGFPQGDPDLEVDFGYGRFFLDPQFLRLIEILKAPVLPCFAICDGEGKLIIRIHSASDASTKEIVLAFGSLYAHYLREFPEFANFWGRAVRREEF